MDTIHITVLFQCALLLFILKRGESCKEGWMQNDGNCYKIFTEKVNKTVAESKCLEFSSALASVSDLGEHTFLAAQLRRDNTSEENFWVGLHKIGNDSLWTNRVPAVNLPWVDVSSSTEDFYDCFIFNSSKVLPADCSENASFVCQQWKVLADQTPSCPEGSRRYDTFSSGVCFWFTHMSMSKAGSEVACTLNHGRLYGLPKRSSVFSLGVLREHRTRNTILWTALKFRNGSLLYENGTEAKRTDFLIGRGDGECCAISGRYVYGRLFRYEMQPKSCFQEALGVCTSSTDPFSQEYYRNPFAAPIIEVNATDPELACPEGNSWQEHNETGFCYWKTTPQTASSFSWEDARKYCQSYGGDLASFHSITEEGIAFEFEGQQSFWIGLYHDLESDRYIWADGTPVDYTNWDDDQPNHQDRRMLCGYMSNTNRKWSLNYCGVLSGFLCKAQKQINPPKAVPPVIEPLVKCTEGSTEYFFKGYCYQKISLLYGWHTSKQYCENKDSNLLSLHSESEVNFVIKLLDITQHRQGNRLWIGLNSLSLGGAFKWTDGTPVDFTNWDVGEPNNFQNQEKCVNMYSQHGMWNDENCNSQMNFICKRRNVTLPGTTTTTTPAPIVGYCQKDWYLFGDRCFLPVGVKKPERKSWVEAAVHCISLGGTLASIRNAKDQALMNYIIQFFQMDAWIGLHDTIHSGVFYWYDNSPLFYTNWAMGEPSSFGFEEDCVIISFESAQGALWKDTDCSLKLPYICQTERNSSISSPSDVRGTRCPHLSDYTQQGLSCFKVFTNASSWEEAQAACGKDHGHLVSIYSYGVLAVVNYLAVASLNDNDTFWIGLQYTGKYPLQWTNGLPMQPSPWGRNEPKEIRGQNTCFFSTVFGSWGGASCSEKKAYICHVTAAVPEEPPIPAKVDCPTDKSPRYAEVGDTCFLFGLRWSVEWYTANFHCSLEGAHLASFHSMDTLDNLQYYLQGIAARESVFIGLCKNPQGGFRWSDGSPVDFVNWDEDEPRDVSHQCVAMRVDTMKWNVVPCDRSKLYICAKDRGNIPQPPTSAPSDSTQGSNSEKHTSLSSSGLSPGAVAAIVIILIVMAVTATVVVLRIRPWKSDENNRYRVRSPEQRTSFENALYSDDLNNVDFHDKQVLFLEK